MNKVFLDAAYAIALSSVSDKHHQKAEKLYEQAIELYRQRQDKEWGITDCISFTVMEEHTLTKALTTDDHFQQAGFSALLLEYTTLDTLEKRS